MRFINIWSYSCAKFMTNQLDEDHKKLRIYYYAFQVIIGLAVKLALMAVISLVLGTFVSTAVVLGSFISLRIIAGGYHMDTYGKCIAVSMIIFTSAGLVVRYTYSYWPDFSVAALVILTFLITLFVISKWAPAQNPNRQYSEQEKRKFKRYSAIHILIWLGLMLLFTYLNLNMYVISSSFGILILSFIISPAGYRFFDVVSGRLDKKK